MHDLAYSADTWPIAACFHGFPASTRDGRSMHDAPDEVWDEVLQQVAATGYRHLELADTHIRAAELPASRRDVFLAIAASHGLEIPSVHVSRRSVIEPGREAENLAYGHRSIDAAAAWGMQVFSTGLHQPLNAAQRDALWFWTPQGPIDPADPAVWERAVSSLRELGEHAASVGLIMSLELYEDTYLGTADSAVELVEAIGLDNVGLNPDVGNLIRLHRPVERWQDLYAKTLPYANYWHAKNYARDEAADGSWATSMPSTLETGLINYRQVLRDAVELGFRGIIMTEQYGGDSLGVGATNREYIRSVLRTIPALSAVG